MPATLMPLRLPASTISTSPVCGSKWKVACSREQSSSSWSEIPDAPTLRPAIVAPGRSSIGGSETIPWPGRKRTRTVGTAARGAVPFGASTVEASSERLGSIATA